MAWTEQSTLFHVGLGFRVGFAGAQMYLFTSIMVCELFYRRCDSGPVCDWLLAQCLEHQNYITSIVLGINY